MIGTTLGAGIGSVIPGVGTAFGGAIGGIYDSISNLFGGSGKTITPSKPEDQAKQRRVALQWLGKLKQIGYYNLSHDYVKNDIIGTHWGGNWAEQVSVVDNWKQAHPLPKIENPITNNQNKSKMGTQQNTNKMPLLAAAAFIAFKYLK